MEYYNSLFANTFSGGKGSPLDCKTEDLEAGEQLSTEKPGRVNVVFRLVQTQFLLSCLSISSSLVCNSCISSITLGFKQKERYN